MCCPNQFYDNCKLLCRHPVTQTEHLTSVLCFPLFTHSIVYESELFWFDFFQPLNPNPDSRWNTYFKDNEILLQIDKDVRYDIYAVVVWHFWHLAFYFYLYKCQSSHLHVSRRLYPDMAFFQRPTEYPCQLILDPQNDYETLRRRVEQTTLKAQTVNRNRSGVTNVSVF